MKHFQSICRSGFALLLALTAVGFLAFDGLADDALWGLAGDKGSHQKGTNGPECECPTPNESHPIGNMPVDYYNGHKIEIVADVTVALTGQDFVWSREYTSDTTIATLDWPEESGKGWMFPEFERLGMVAAMPTLPVNPSNEPGRRMMQLTSARKVRTWANYFVEEIPGNPPTYVEHSQVGEFYDEPDLTWRPGGAGTDAATRTTTDYIDLANVFGLGSPGIRDVVTIAITEPGVGVKHFFRDRRAAFDPPGSIEAPSALLGRMVYREDVYGNSWHYEYVPTSIGGGDVPLDGQARVAAIRFIRADGELEARVEFDWIEPGDLTFDELDWRLRRVRVLRPEGGCDSAGESSCTLLEVQRVEYKYYDDFFEPDAEIAPGLCPYAIGSSQDLVQAIVYERLDGRASNAPSLTTLSLGYEASMRAHQYRYYSGMSCPGDGGSSNQPPSGCAECFPVDELDDNLDDELGARLGVIEPSGDNPLSVFGRPHQLRVVFSPEQLEYYADRAATVLATPVSALEYVEDIINNTRLSTVYSSSTPIWHFASKVVTYDMEGRVRSQYLLNPNCGCGGGSGTLSTPVRLEYIYKTWLAPSPYSRSVFITESYRNSYGQYTPYREYIKDLAALANTTNSIDNNNVPFLINDVVIDATDDTRSRVWVTHYVYDQFQRVVRVMRPSATHTYTYEWPSVPTDIVSPPSYEAHMDRGLVEAVSWTVHHRPWERLVREGAGEEGTTGRGPRDVGEVGADASDFTLVERAYYGATSSGAERDYLVTETRRYRSSSSSPDTEIERQYFSYGYHTPGGGDIAWVRKEVEQNLESENGAGAGESSRHASYELFDSFGRNAWSVDAHGSLTAREFQTGTGLVVREALNAEWDGDPLDFDDVDDTGWDTNADGGALVTAWSRDPLGRVTSEVSPGEVVRYFRHELHNYNGTPGKGISHFTVVELPHVLSGCDSMSDCEASHPAVTTVYSAEGRELERRTAALDELELASTPTNFDHPVSSYSLDSTLLSRTLWNRGVTGALRALFEWVDATQPASLTDPDIIYITSYVYDELGRLRVRANPNGTVQRYSYDVRDRLIKTEEGTLIAGTADLLKNDGTGNLVTVQERQYDHILPDGKPNTGGIGDGHLTGVIDHVDGVETREAVMWRDYRGRNTWTVHPESPHELREYDNLDRVIARSLYAAAPTVSPSLATTYPGVTDRGLYEEFDYSQRGLLYRRARAINPTSSDPDFLEWHSWHDEEGREIASWGPNGPGVKRRFDALGRIVMEALTDRSGDALPGLSDNYADASSLTGDVVLEQREFVYHEDISGSGPNVGQLTLEITRRRSHDATLTGDLAAHTGAQVVSSFHGYRYDSADRLIASIDFGNNLTDPEMRSGGAAPTTTDIATPPAFARVFETTYNARGLVDTESSAREVGSPSAKILTKYAYDDLDRRVAVIENWTDSTVAPSTSVDWGFALAFGSGHDSGDASQDRATITVYNSTDDVVFLVAAHDDGIGAVEYQATEYVYGAALGSGTPGVSIYTGNLGANGSELFSNDLLARIVYPDVEGTLAHHSVAYRYNRQGELIGMTDQNGTVHDYERDARGRLTGDGATMISSDIDGWVDRVETTYDAMGRRETVRSKLASSGAVRNAVKFEYTDLWQVAQVTQNPAGDLGDDHEGSVEYLYDTADIAGGNYSRLAHLQYPTPLPWPGQSPTDGTRLKHFYGATQSGSYQLAANNAISRLDGLNWLPDDAATPLVEPDDPIVEHRFLGMRDMVFTRYEHPGVRLDRTTDPLAASSPGVTAGVYPGLDPFGRVRKQTWLRDTWAHGAKPAIFDLQYEHDEDSNVVDRIDRRAEDRSTRPGRDETNRYDPINRLTQADRGSYDHSSSVFTVGGLPNAGQSQKWSLDGVGNWTLFQTDLDNDGSFGGTNDRDDARAYNLANEMVDQSIDGANPLNQVYDKAGNLVQRRIRISSSVVATWIYTYDAWNRLVRVSVDPDDAGSLPPQDRVRYSYNGLHWRTTRVADSDADIDNKPDQANLYYYDASWRLLEERVDDDFASEWSTGAPGDSNGDFTLFDGGDVDGAGGGADGDSGRGDRVVQRFWRSDYIDAFIAQATSAWNATEEEYDAPTTHYALTDRLFSVIAMTEPDGAIAERVRYTPYGQARHQWPHDVDGNGAAGGGEFGELNPVLSSFAGYGGGSAYTPDADFDQDGAVTFNELNRVLGPSVPAITGGAISDRAGAANSVGYSGYHFDPAAGPEGLYLARHRWYDPAIGAWITRDPIGYADGMGLYEYVAGDPLWGIDPWGLAVIKEGPLDHPLSPDYGTDPCCGPPSGLDNWLDRKNIKPVHEEIFYDDDDSVGFSPTGNPVRSPGKIGPAPSRPWRQVDPYWYDDGIMRDAVDACSINPAMYELKGNNCQHWIDSVRKEYLRRRRSFIGPRSPGPSNMPERPYALPGGGNNPFGPIGPPEPPPSPEPPPPGLGNWPDHLR